MQVFHEALRLCPPAAGVGRLAVRDIAVDGYRVQKGSLVAVGIYALHHDPTLWDRPETSIPTGSARRTSRAATGGSSSRSQAEHGPCIGEHFARLETTLALATIVRSTRIRSLGDDFPVEVPFTTVAKGPIWARVSPRR